jgi:predicted transposase YdaD
LVEAQREGRALGHAEGRAEGRTEERKEVARNFKNLGTSTEVIQKATALSLEEIESL